mgnify:CR=1 FL=1
MTDAPEFVIVYVLLAAVGWGLIGLACLWVVLT